MEKLRVMCVLRLIIMWLFHCAFFSEAIGQNPGNTYFNSGSNSGVMRPIGDNVEQVFLQHGYVVVHNDTAEDFSFFAAGPSMVAHNGWAGNLGGSVNLSPQIVPPGGVISGTYRFTVNIPRATYVSGTAFQDFTITFNLRRSNTVVDTCYINVAATGSIVVSNVGSKIERIDLPAVNVHLYASGAPALGREGLEIDGDELQIKASIYDGRVGGHSRMGVRVGGRYIPLGNSNGSNPVKEQLVETTVTEVAGGAQVNGVLVELMADDETIAQMTTPSTFTDNFYLADFGKINWECESCGVCTPGKADLKLDEDSIAKIDLGTAGPNGEGMSLELEADTLVGGAVKADSFEYFGPLSGSVEVIGTPGQGHRQFVNASGLTDVVDNLDGSGNYVNTEIKIYREPGTKSGSYYPGSNLQKTIRFAHTFTPVSGQPPESAGTDSLTVTEIDSGGTKVSQYTYDRALKQRTLETAAGRRKEVRTQSVGSGTRSVTTEVRSETDALSRKIVQNFTTFGWGEELTSEVNDPAGSERTANWTYETNSSVGAYKKVISRTDADGYWERYTYHADGRREKVISQYAGASVGASEGVSRVVTTTYDGENYTEVETLLGQEVARRYFVRTVSGSETIEKTEVCTVPGSALGAPTNLVTTKVLRSNETVVNEPDGVMKRTITASATGGGIVTTVEEGAASGGAVTDGTRRVLEKDAMGNEVQSSVYDIASNTLILQATTTAADLYGRPTTIAHLNGTSESKTYGCCGLEQWIDAEGITTTYGYDDFGNIDRETRAGLTISKTYDELGRLRLVTRTGSDEIPITIGGSDYNLAGQETLRRSILGNSTIADVKGGDGTWTRTETLPGGATRIRQRTSDALLLSVSGTAEYPLIYEYGVTSGQRYVKETKLGTSGATSEWMRATMDAAGRVVKNTFADNAEISFIYNTKGQLVRRIDPDSVSVVFGYNSRGDRVSTTLDLDRDGTTDSGEPTTVTTRTVLSDKVRTAVTEASDAGPVTVSVVEQNITNLNRTESAFGLSTTIGVTLGSGTITEVATLPDSSTVTRTYTDGRLTGMAHTGGGKTSASISYEYDARGRLWKEIDARTGTTTYTYHDTDLLSTIAKGVLATAYNYNLQGQRTEEVLPGSRTLTRSYRPTGEVLSESGNATYPISYAYDPQGRRTGMTTSTGTTTWGYDPQRGWLDFKKDAANESVTYTYSPAARPLSRTWARGVTTTYGYDNGGRISSATYSDGTPAVIYGYNARNYVSSIADAGGTHSLSYALHGVLATDSITGGLLEGVSASSSFDTLLRKGGFQVTRNSTSLAVSSRSYDALSRLDTVTSGTDTAIYTYHPNSSLVDTITFARSGSTKVITTKEFDDFNRLESILSQPAVGSASGIEFFYNLAGEREKATSPDGNYWSYNYNSRSELTSGVKKMADDNALSGYQFAYTFDNIGNRLTTERNTRTSIYTPNNLNQYTERSVPSYADILGKAESSLTINVNGLSTIRQGDGYFHAELSVNNSAAAVNLTTTVTASDGTDEVETSGRVYVPSTPESFTYDEDGNLLSDGAWNYVWDAENRLRSMETATEAVSAGVERQRLSFAYDYAGRRISKKVEDHRNGVFIERFTLLYVYDGWNLASEYVRSGGVPIRNYVWGSDLNGGTAAGGIGGLLFINQLPEAKTFSVAYDGNGNVINLYDQSDSSVAATYEYSPFGKLLRSTGTFARVNPIRFSTKYQDEESSLVYYGYRYYDAELGRWLSRDPLGESGGVNLYGFVGNNPTRYVDALGLFLLDDIDGSVQQQAIDKLTRDRLSRFYESPDFYDLARYEADSRASLYSKLQRSDLASRMSSKFSPMDINACLKAATLIVDKDLNPEEFQRLACMCYDKRFSEVWRMLDPGEGFEWLLRNPDMVMLEAALFFMPLSKLKMIGGATESTTFYTVQSADDVARLMSGGTPWPASASRAALGEGVYSFDNLASAESYAARLSSRGAQVQVKSFSVSDDALLSFRSANVDALENPEAFLSRYSKLFGGTPDHGLEYIQRGTQFGTEHFFDKSVIHILQFD